ncbi:extracellular solute-binding protein [Auraticoccus sp. F435]|uniref:Extracellular solute-binding protein n=1 Tax=Auraticoccus cholistanensis TaxID=2656650 RepID=A0A6A9US31_9ACTN|nr:extracellular solute-binding protein [Auraticoccus cholistanensis]MVA74562.1 extracellular solute-binding protein [Auraticoccus cholistanensis]
MSQTPNHRTEQPRGPVAFSTALRGRRHRRVLAASVLGLSLLVAACNPAAQQAPAPAEEEGGIDFAAAPTGALAISGYNPSDDVAQARADHAESQLADVDIKLDTTSFDTQKFAAQAASGDVPDLIRADRNLIATLADQELIMPIDECYAAKGVQPREYFYPATIDDVTYDGAVYGVPEFFQPSALLVNTRVLDEAGVGLDEVSTADPAAMVSLAERLSEVDGGTPKRLGFDADLPGSAAMWMVLRGGKVQEADGRPALDSPENVATLTWMKELMDAQGGYPAIKSFKDSQDVFGEENPYSADEVAIGTWAQWYVNVLSDYAEDIELAAVPITDATGQPFAMAGGSAFAIPAAAANPAAACAWAVSVTSQEAWMAAGDARAATVEEEDAINTGLFTGSPVADQAVREAHVGDSGSEQFDQVISTYYDVLANPRTRGASAVGEQIGNDLENAVIVTLSDESTPEEALAEAQASSMRAWEQSRAGS